MAESDEETPSKRELHFGQQRSSYRSSLQSQKSTNPPQRSRPTSGQAHFDDFDLDLDHRLHAEYAKYADHPDSETVPSDASPAPNVPYTKAPRGDSGTRRKGSRRGRSLRERSRSGPDEASRLEELLSSDSWLRANEPVPSRPIALSTLSDPGLREPGRREYGNDPPPRSPRTPRSQQGGLFPRLYDPRTQSTSQVDLTALPNMSNPPTKQENPMDAYHRSKPNAKAQRGTEVATQLYTISYLIFFAIWGTLARVGLQALTFYPGAPVIFSELWANVAGTFIMGFLTEDRRLFRSEWGRGEPVPEPADRPAQTAEEDQREKARHGKIKKTIPMYIGVATGFCGSLTSFSSFMRDVFLSLSNNLPSPINHPYPAGAQIPASANVASRRAGDSVMAILATVFITVTTCYAALHMGAHLAAALDRYTPSLPFRFARRIIDPLFVFLAWGTWLGALLLAIFPPHNAWRGQAVLACVFAPLGCLARYYVSILLNPIKSSFPLGTFTVNIFGTAVLGMAYDLQRVPLLATSIAGGSIAGCQVLQGIMDGFCGCLTTVSTWIVEIDSLKRRAGYLYGGASVVGGVCLLVVIMGSVRWSVGWEAIACTT